GPPYPYPTVVPTGPGENVSRSRRGPPSVAQDFNPGRHGSRRRHFSRHLSDRNPVRNSGQSSRYADSPARPGLAAWATVLPPSGLAACLLGVVPLSFWDAPPHSSLLERRQGQRLCPPHPAVLA